MRQNKGGLSLWGFLNIQEITGTFKKKLLEFKSSLGEAVRYGKEIPFADNDINYSLKLQNENMQPGKRLRKKRQAGNGRKSILRMP